jgi:CheY-like chemotaxis protein
MPKILVVDESPAVRMLIEQAFSAERIEVLFAPSGADAVERIERDVPDLVLCDVYMPDMDGYRICDFVKTHPSLGETPVLLVAEVVDTTVLARAARVRPDDILRKPFVADLLLGRIRSLLPPAVRAEPPSLPHDVVSGAEDAVDVALGRLADLPGVALGVLVDRDGFLIECAGDLALEAEVVGAVVSRLSVSSDEIGRELGRGALRSVIFEYEDALVLLSDVGADARLAVIFRDPTSLGMVRDVVKEIAQAWARHEIPAVIGAA